MTSNKPSIKLAGCLLAVTFAFAGCANMNGSNSGQNTAIGAGAGAALGAGLGVLIGDSGKSAAIGAGIGALVGGVAGYNWDRIKNDVRQSGADELGIDVIEMPDGSLKVNIPSNVSFDSGKYALKPALKPVLDSVATALINHPELRAVAIGYTDSTGNDAINQPLSLNRARAVTNYLAADGVSPNRLVAQGRGSADPIGDNSTAAGRALNRRVELFLYAPQ